METIYEFDMQNIAKVASIIILIWTLVIVNTYFQPSSNKSLIHPQLVIAGVSNPTNYQNSSFGFMLEYPSNWNIIEDDRGIWLRTPDGEGNLRIQVQDYNNSLPQFSTEQINATQKQFPGRVLSESNETKIGNTSDGHSIVFTYTEEPSDVNGVVFKEMRSWLLENNKAYILSFFSRNDTFNTYLPSVHSIINSMKLTRN